MYDVINPGAGLGQTHKFGSVKPIDVIAVLLFNLYMESFVHAIVQNKELKSKEKQTESSE
jgi:hypothetical protein